MFTGVNIPLHFRFFEVIHTHLNFFVVNYIFINDHTILNVKRFFKVIIDGLNIKLWSVGIRTQEF